MSQLSHSKKNSAENTPHISTSSLPPSPAALAIWLKQQHIDTTRWGQGNAKSVADLWHEVQAGESVLSGHPLRRIVQVASIIVRSGDRILVEAAQHFYDGRIRERNHPPSEKMQAGETILVAALRGLQEELNVAETDITLLPESVTRYTKTIDSYSFPGLTATYEFYVIEALIPSLPRHAFETVNLAPKELDPVHIHHWAWQPTVGKLARYQRA